MGGDLARQPRLVGRMEHGALDRPAQALERLGLGLGASERGITLDTPKDTPKRTA
jgi:hypothetical protein